MKYFKLNNIDFSDCVNELIVTNNVTYRSQTNAAGNTVVDNANTKRIIEVGIIPLVDDKRIQLMQIVNDFQVNVSFLNPSTGVVEDNILCIIPTNKIEYYTIQIDKAMTKAYKLQFIEL